MKQLLLLGAAITIFCLSTQLKNDKKAETKPMEQAKKEQPVIENASYASFYGQPKW